MALHPEVKVMLEALEASGWVDPSQLAPQQAREQSAYFSKLRQFPGPLSSVQSADYDIPVDSKQEIVARAYYPKSQIHPTVVVFYHGGGYVLANIEQYDIACRWMCSILEVPVVSVDYRLAPENPFPIPIQDGYQALSWIKDHFELLNLKCDQIIVAGDSAGGHLATMVSILARDQFMGDKSGPAPLISWQWLIYPWIDNDFSHQSYATFYSGFGLSTPGTQWFNENYLQGHHIAEYPAFPLHFTNLTNLPPTYIVVAENDVLLDEGKLYAEKLGSSGNKVCFELAEGMIHGFMNHYSIPASYRATLKMFQKMKSLLLEELKIPPREPSRVRRNHSGYWRNSKDSVEDREK